MTESEYITIQVKRSDYKSLENLKDHPRQPIHEVVSEVVGIATKARRGE